jgi:hypothetical protein
MYAGIRFAVANESRAQIFRDTPRSDRDRAKVDRTVG